MANPIEPTPPFEGEEARRILDELNGVQMSDDERKRRVREAGARVAELTKPKGFR